MICNFFFFGNKLKLCFQNHTDLTELSSHILKESLCLKLQPILGSTEDKRAVVNSFAMKGR